MQFKEFDWLGGHGIWAIIPCPTNMISVLVNFWRRFDFHFSLVFQDFEGFLIKRLFHSPIWDDYSQLGAKFMQKYQKFRFGPGISVSKFSAFYVHNRDRPKNHHFTDKGMWLSHVNN